MKPPSIEELRRYIKVTHGYAVGVQLQADEYAEQNGLPPTAILTPDFKAWDGERVDAAIIRMAKNALDRVEEFFGEDGEAYKQIELLRGFLSRADFRVTARTPANIVTGLANRLREAKRPVLTSITGGLALVQKNTP